MEGKKRKEKEEAMNECYRQTFEDMKQEQNPKAKFRATKYIAWYLSLKELIFLGWFSTRRLLSKCPLHNEEKSVQEKL